MKIQAHSMVRKSRATNPLAQFAVFPQEEMDNRNEGFEEEIPQRVINKEQLQNILDTVGIGFIKKKSSKLTKYSR